MRAISLKSLAVESGSELDRSAITISVSDDDVQYMDFDDFIAESCRTFNCPVSVTVYREIIRDQPASRSARQKTKIKRKSLKVADWLTPKHKRKPYEQVDDHTLLIKAFYDDLDGLVEILITKFNYHEIPQLLMQLIALKVPYTRNLTKFTIKQCRININTVNELHKILLSTNITDVCLDHSPLKESNYDILLSDRSMLRNLSLSRCDINDIVCERIAARLRHLEPAEPTLLALNLSSNHITDVGAKHLGEALRCNRHLRYLNMADNHIGDDGARYIFDVLTEFPLTTEEIVDKGDRYKNYWRMKNTLYKRNMDQLCNNTGKSLQGKKSPKKGTPVKSKPSAKKCKIVTSVQVPDENLKTKAYAMAEDTLGLFKDPFSSSTVTLKDGYPYSIGNFVLCYLNLAYNNLTFLSVQKLLALVMYQKKYRNEDLCGLLNVLIEGNIVPGQCNEYNSISNELAEFKCSLKKTRSLNISQRTIVSSR